MIPRTLFVQYKLPILSYALYPFVLKQIHQRNNHYWNWHHIATVVLHWYHLMKTRTRPHAFPGHPQRLRCVAQAMRTPFHKESSFLISLITSTVFTLLL